MKLQHMVIEAIADSADIGLLDSLIPKMSVGVFRQLSKALMSRWSSVAPYIDLIAKQGDLESQGGKSEVGSPKTELQGPEKLESTPDSQLASEMVPGTTYQGSTEETTDEHYP